MRTLPLLLFVAFGLAAAGQNGKANSGSVQQNTQARGTAAYSSLAQEPDELRQELDRDAVALSKVPADPVLATDPFALILEPFERLTDRITWEAVQGLSHELLARRHGYAWQRGGRGHRL